MNKSVLSVLMFLACVFFSTPALHAQAPSVTGVGASGGGLLLWNSYWSVYGSNLTAVGPSWVFMQIPNGAGYSTKTFSATQNNPGYWYESASQINFYAGDYGTFRVYGTSYLTVCTTYGGCGGGGAVAVNTWN